MTEVGLCQDLTSMFESTGTDRYITNHPLTLACDVANRLQGLNKSQQKNSCMWNKLQDAPPVNLIYSTKACIKFECQSVFQIR